MKTDLIAATGLRLTSEQWRAVGFLAEFAKRMVVLALAERKTPAKASNLIAQVYRVTDNMLAGCLKTGPKPPCKIGCFRCCYIQVRRCSETTLYSFSDFTRKTHLKTQSYF